MFVKSMAAAGAMLALSTLTAGAVTAVAETDLNVRAGPGTNFEVVGVLPEGSPVDVINCSGSWCRVAGNARGFASRAYLSIGGQARAVAPTYEPDVYANYGYYDYGYGDPYVYGPSVGVVVGPGFRHYRYGHQGGNRNWQGRQGNWQGRQGNWQGRNGQGAGRWQGQTGGNRSGFAGAKSFGGASAPSAPAAGGRAGGGQSLPGMKGGG